MTKTMENYLKQIEKKYAKKPRVAWLHKWVLEAFAGYASLASYEKALKAKGLKKNTVYARVSVVRRYLKDHRETPEDPGRSSRESCLKTFHFGWELPAYSGWLFCIDRVSSNARTRLPKSSAEHQVFSLS
jgi:hypothetical protein